MEDMRLKNEKGGKKKRKSAYSRKGCLQCKKAHTKCDEQKPKCTRCVRRSIDCVYKNNFVFQKDYQDGGRGGVFEEGGDGGGAGGGGGGQMYGYQHGLMNLGPGLTAGGLNRSSTSSIGFGVLPGISGPYMPGTGRVLPPLQLEPNIGGVSDTAEEQGQLKGQGSIYVGGGQSLPGQPVVVVQSQLHSLPQTQGLANNMSVQGKEQLAPLRMHGSSSTSGGPLGDSFSSDSHLNVDTPGHIDVREYIHISREDWNFINYLRYAQRLDNKTMTTTIGNLDFDQTSGLFQFSWRKMTTSEVEKVFNTYDPIQQIYVPNNVNLGVIIQMDDLKVSEFCWTLMRCGAIGGGIALFPYDTHLDPLLKTFFSMSKVYPLVNDVFIYASAIFMKDVYANLNLEYFSHLWDRYVRIPALKRCLDQMVVVMQKSDDFCDNIAFTFALSSFFAVEGASKSSAWRLHLQKVCDMFKKVESLTPQAFEGENIDFTAYECYLFLKDWFCHSETLAWISADNGGCLDNESDLEKLLSNRAYSKFNLLNDTYDLYRGYTIHFYPLFTKLSAFLLRKKKEGILLTGTNIIKSLFTGIDKSLSVDLNRFGDELLHLLQCIPTDDDHLDKVTNGLDDLRLKLALKNCTRMYHTALELYTEVFFVRKPVTKIYYKPRIEKMIELLFSIPYLTTCSIVCHWPIYVGAIISLLLKEKNLYEHFVLVLNDFSSSGIMVASNSVERLTRISKVLACGNYDDLVSPAHDYVVY